ncbi:hypothetical protein ACE1CI_02665 [Aerosakkonemataceae cyanobacterium BLCC-F50]|uniref:Uncharacterized protein n=1 Tax=Floridaenema flaviceps BLCC-F50 TaxID=3153642 RepID=A0ABV4XJE8_9CYAN
MYVYRFTVVCNAGSKVKAPSYTALNEKGYQAFSFIDQHDSHLESIGIFEIGFISAGLIMGGF